MIKKIIENNFPQVFSGLFLVCGVMGSLMRPLELTIKALDDVITQNSSDVIIKNDVFENNVSRGIVDLDVEQSDINRRPFLNRPQSEKVYYICLIQF